jgi:hypothetical protein
MPARRDTQSTAWKEEIRVNNGITPLRCEIREDRSGRAVQLVTAVLIAQIASDGFLIMIFGKQRI